ncbi:tetratricopeptide repeat protein [Algibacter mikhailovii]|uniref:tetratricopeptide repeat protein n=1 Tax=Algibacter mikhailovii TaxID=425498 RepID=UPI002494D94F|nr:tetratricopeptide repeat protein [Algibacter mikhailovii]
MKQTVTFVLLFLSFLSFSQETDKEKELAMKRANNYVYEGNSLISEEDFISAEMEYRMAISEQSSLAVGTYNLAHAYIENGNPEEALFRLDQVVKTSTSKSEKHKAFHNMGNVLMQNEKCKEAVEAYKSALRNNPSDDETRYNLSVAKACAEEQKEQEDQNKDQDQDQNDENQDDQDKKEDQENQDQEGDNEDDEKDKGDQDEQDGDEEQDDEGKPEEDKKDEDKGDKEKKEQPQKPQPQPGQLSPQQINSLLEAMNNQEQKVQEKMNAEKQKGVKIKTDKDW